MAVEYLYLINDLNCKAEAQIDRWNKIILIVAKNYILLLNIL